MHPAPTTRPAPLGVRLALGLAVFVLLLLAGLAAANVGHSGARAVAAHPTQPTPP